MNKSAIQAYTEWAKVELTNAVKQKAFEYGITETSISEADDVANGRVLNRIEQKQRSQLVSEIKEKGYKNVIEEVTYTWFNRFIALRFMEVNGYLPSHTRVFSDDENKFNPQILKEALTVEIDGLDREIIVDYLDKNNSEGLFKYLIISQCNALNKIIPVLFEKISNYTELLFPNNLLKKDSVLDKLVNDIPEEDWKDQVQILGWIYQFYIADKKDAAFKSKETITKDTLAAVTQLFTPDWIVRYMAENSLGRLWLESYPNSSLKNEMKYFVEDAPQSEEVKNKIEEIKYRDVNPENIHIIEPCCGSGHILVYVFDLLVKIYEEKGYKKSDIPTLILRKNLVGLDIDKRASQLAYFSLMMKARSVDNRLFAREEIAHPMIFEIVDSETIFEDDFEEIMSKHNFSRESINTAKYLADTFKHGKVIGSLLIVNRKDYHSFISELKEKKNTENWNIFETHFQTSSIDLLIRLARLAIVMSNKYDVMITNPPYISLSTMESFAKDYAQRYYESSKTDMYSMFMESNFVKKNGFISMINMHSWMFLSSFENLRNKLLNHKTIISLNHLGPRAFEMISGEVVQTVSFVLRNLKLEDYAATAIRLVDFNSQNEKEVAFREKKANYVFPIVANEILAIPGYEFIYWLSPEIRNVFSLGDALSKNNRTAVGLSTGDNNRFTRLWWEVDRNNLCLDATSCSESTKSGKRWFPYNKGGEYKKWYGNNDCVVDWYKDGYEIRNFKGKNGRLASYPRNTDCYFKESITWSKVSSGPISFRFKPNGHVFDVAGTSVFANNHDMLLYLCGIMNSSLIMTISKAIAPTLNYEVGQIGSIPIIIDKDKFERLISLVNECIALVKNNYDQDETSWDFKVNSFLKFDGITLKERWNKWNIDTLESIQKLKQKEEEINLLVCEIYGVNPDSIKWEFLSSIPERNFITDIKSLISFFVGCLFGRFAIDYDSDVFVEKHLATDFVDVDNIIPICDDEYFDDDIVGKFVTFIKTLFGEMYLEENLKIISDSLGGNGTPRQIIREYFVSNFYKDHLSTYHNRSTGSRPIYWLFDSGKINGFKALIYIHNYKNNLIAKMRTDYVHEQQERYRTQIGNLESDILHLDGGDRAKANKKLSKIKEQLFEINEYEEKIHHLADQMIEIDLDDGVKVNYAKFQDVLAPIK